jgi:hypothetical protein
MINICSWCAFVGLLHKFRYVNHICELFKMWKIGNRIFQTSGLLRTRRYCVRKYEVVLMKFWYLDKVKYRWFNRLIFLWVLCITGEGLSSCQSRVHRKVLPRRQGRTEISQHYITCTLLILKYAKLLFDWHEICLIFVREQNIILRTLHKQAPEQIMLLKTEGHLSQH